MPPFPSRAWMEEFCRLLGEDPRAPQISAALDGVYRFVVETGGPISETHEFDVEIRPGTPHPRIGLVENSADAPRLTLSAGHQAWRQLIAGQLNVAMAVMTGRVRVGGDVSGLMGQMTSVEPLMDALQGVDTQWPR